MDSKIIAQLSAYPQKLDDLAWLEEEFESVADSEVLLNWNKTKKCVETQLTQENYDVHYLVLEYWAMYVGAEFLILNSTRNENEMKAYIYP